MSSTKKLAANEKDGKMKITRKQIRQIIKEEIETLSQEEKTISAEEQESAFLARDRAEDLETVDDAWAGGSNLVHPIDFEDIALTDDKVVRGHQVLKIVENIMNEGFMKERFGEIENAIIAAVEEEPSIAGADLVDKLLNLAPVDDLMQDEIFSVLDIMQEDGTIFFDSEDDAWFTTMEDLLAYREGGVWSDDEDYEAGWYR